MPTRYYTAKDAAELAKCHLTVEQVRCHDASDPSRPCPDCGGEVRILVETAWAHKALVAAKGGALITSSIHRCRKKQERLWREAITKYGSEAEASKHVARPGGGPHEESSAIDYRRPDRFQSSSDFQAWIVGVLGGDCRTGVYPWGVHMDRAHKLDPNPDPVHYRRGAHW